MFKITNIFGKISTSILDNSEMKWRIWSNTSICSGCVHFRLIFQSQNIDYFTPNQKLYAYVPIKKIWEKN